MEKTSLGVERPLSVDGVDPACRFRTTGALNVEHGARVGDDANH